MLRPTPYHRRRRPASRGFTLIEILIVIALIGILATLTVSNVGGIFGTNQEKIAKFYVRDSIQLPLNNYRLDMGSYPNSELGLQALFTAPGNAGTKWKGPYSQDPNFEDPWGNAYQYKYPGEKNPLGSRSYDIWSMGPDGQSGTDDDIGNWD